MLPIGHQIYTKRLERGITQTELAQKARIPQPNLSNIEKGRQDVTLSTLRRIADGLGVELVDFFKNPKRESVSWSRSVIERMAYAVATNRKYGLSPKERKIAALFQDLIPELRKGRSNIKKIGRSWLELRKELDLLAINNVTNRVRDVWARRK